jgi:hypothetical protein
MRLLRRHALRKLSGLENPSASQALRLVRYAAGRGR